MEIKAIETHYNGYKFRSRLEARWAVFFDEAGIEYQYEPEGFDINGTWYLPDFYLPWYKCYVEIKPKDSKELQDAENKLWGLFWGKDDCCCMLCVGDPLDNNITVYCQDTNDDGGGESEFEARFLEGVCWEDKYGWRTNGKHYISLVCNVNKETSYHDRNWHILPLSSSYSMVEYRNDFGMAKEKARQARFEHGQKGL